ncbi:divalent-cation tolerance protein CutA [Blastococcus sp. TF02A-26]|nr:divalent-cation tolerance protein CutA [Blastococcus sp. TF02A-26]
MDDECCEVVVTAADPEELAGLTRDLVDRRLAACGHVVPAIRSIYRWEGAVHDEPEARVALHTRRALVSAIVEHVTAVHPYDVPCVIALPLVDGAPDYLAWVRRETQHAPTPPGEAD